MATKTTNPALSKLMSQSGAWNKARTQKNPFRGNCEAPPGNYYARVTGGRLSLTQNKDPMASIYLTILCDEDGDQSQAGEQPRVIHVFKSSAKQTVEDKFARFCYDLQDLGYDTSELELEEIEEALKMLAADKPFTKISISEGDNGGFTNFRGLVSEEDIAELTGGSIPDTEEGEEQKEETEEEEQEEEAEEEAEEAEEAEEEGYESEYEEVEEEAEEETEEEEEAEEEEAPPPKPAKKKVAKKAAPPPVPAKKAVKKAAPAPAAKPAAKKVVKKAVRR